MINKTLELILKDDKTQATLVTARQFCAFVDGLATKEYTQENFIDLLHIRLLDLYSKSVQLPKIELVFSGNDALTEKEKEETDPTLYKRLSGLLGEYTDYSQTFDPTILDDKDNCSSGWLVDDIADIHKDLKGIIQNMEKGTDNSVQQGLWDLKWGLAVHWGQHLIDALRFLHYIKYDHLHKHMS